MNTPGQPEKKKYAFIANGVVAFVREFGIDEAAPEGFVPYRDAAAPDAGADHDAVTTGHIVDADGYCTPAWTTTPKVDAKAPPAPTQTPVEVPLWAFRAVLTLLGIAPKVEALIAALPEPDKTVASTQWVYGNYISRHHPLIEACGAQLGMADAQIDAVFVQADGLK